MQRGGGGFTVHGCISGHREGRRSRGNCKGWRCRRDAVEERLGGEVEQKKNQKILEDPLIFVAF